MKQMLNSKSVAKYGVIKPNSINRKRFDDSKLFPKSDHYAVLLKKLKVYFGKNKFGKKALLDFEAYFINYKNGQKIESGLHGAILDEEEIDTQEIIVQENDYITNFEMAFLDTINYIKISSKKGKIIEFGERPEKPIKILNYEGDNMIQFFWGDIESEEGINAIGFKYISRKNFVFGSILPIIKLRYKLNHDEKFKNTYEKNYKELLKNEDISMIYLLKTCLLPNTVFSRIIKYC